MTVVACELGDERFRIGMSLERQGRQIETGGPAFGSLVESGDRLGSELDADGLPEQPVGVVAGEPQIVGTDLVQLAAGLASGRGGTVGRTE